MFFRSLTNPVFKGQGFVKELFFKMFNFKLSVAEN